MRRQLEAVAADPLFHARIGRSSAPDAMDAAMVCATCPGAKAVFVP